jgi:hypothetical protein
MMYNLLSNWTPRHAWGPGSNYVKNLIFKGLLLLNLTLINTHLNIWTPRKKPHFRGTKAICTPRPMPSGRRHTLPTGKFIPFYPYLSTPAPVFLNLTHLLCLIHFSFFSFFFHFPQIGGVQFDMSISEIFQTC